MVFLLLMDKDSLTISLLIPIQNVVQFYKYWIDFY